MHLSIQGHMKQTKQDEACWTKNGNKYTTAARIVSIDDASG